MNEIKIRLTYIELDQDKLDSISYLVDTAKATDAYKNFLFAENAHDHDIYFNLEFGYETVDVIFY